VVQEVMGWSHLRLCCASVCCCALDRGTCACRGIVWVALIGGVCCTEELRHQRMHDSHCSKLSANEPAMPR
jgi:hypothetical protein